MYFNYQFHLEGIPKDGKVLVIRNEHLIHDWNHVEHFIGGGVKEIIDPNRGNETIGVMNKSKKDQSHKQLSKDSTKIICRQLCNEIVSYKKILRRSLNLNYQDIEESIEELRETCGKYADYEEGDCSVPMPDITEKLIVNRGYNDLVMEKEYISQSEKLETTLHTSNTDEKLEAQALMDDDSYSI
jgi:predicted AlkP superfamily phosphohydrolase/phosphomutase